MTAGGRAASAGLRLDWSTDDRSDLVPAVPTLAPDTPTADAPTARGRHLPLIGRLGAGLRPLFDRLIASSSLVSNDPVLDVRDFAWTASLRDGWQAIRAEADALRGARSSGLSIVPSDAGAIPGGDAWRSLFLWNYGGRVAGSADRCPRTVAILRAIPGLTSASFSILAPGTHVPGHRGATKGLITCHLGLRVPRDGDVRMRVGNRVLRWAEGETLVFDDTCRHEAWNDARGTQVVLAIQFERPLRQPGKWLADLFMAFVKRSAFMQETPGNGGG